MYALTRGVVSVLAVGCAYWLGFAGAGILRQDIDASATVLGVALALLILANVSLILLRNHASKLTKRRIELGYAIVLLIAFWFIGYAFGLHCQITTRYTALLVFLSAWAIVAALRALAAYKGFAEQFAATVWRDYLAYNASVALHQTAEH
jgi:hypothetical protein